MLSRLGWADRIFAAVWFGGTAVVPIFLLVSTTGFGTKPESFEYFFLFGTPVFLAAVAGFGFGSTILDRSRTRNGLVAATRGLITAATAFIVYVLFLAIYGGFPIYASRQSLGEQAAALVGLIVLYLVFGSMIAGWLVLIAGSIGGSLLYTFSHLPGKRRVKSGPAGLTRRSVALVAGLLLFDACVVPIGLTFISARRQERESILQFEEMRRLRSPTDSGLDLLRSKLEAGADPNFPDDPAGPLLESAATNGQEEIVNLLLAHGADPNRTSNHGWPPIVSAANYPDAEMVRVLIRAGANVNKPANDGFTALMNASLHSNLTVVEILLQNGSAINARDSEGKTALGAVKERKQKYFTGRTDTSPEIDAESDALDKMIALLTKNGAQE